MACAERYRDRNHSPGMAMRPRGRTMTVITGAAALAVAGIALKDRVREAWWIHELETGDDAAVARAAEVLGEMGSVRSVPVLARNLMTSYESGFADFGVDPAVRQALSRIGARAVPALILELGEDSPGRLGAAWILGEIGPPAASAIPALEALATNSPYLDVRQAAARSAAMIRGE